MCSDEYKFFGRPTKEESKKNNSFDGRFRKGVLSGKLNTLNEQYTYVNVKGISK